MVNRNDLCPCNSGKKFKKCCGTKQTTDINSIITEELDRIMENFGVEAVSKKNFNEVSKRTAEWTTIFQHTFEQEFIQTLAMETYIYLDHADIWNHYLQKQLTKPHRLQVLDVLQSWLHPFLLLAKVEKHEGDHLYLVDEMTNTHYHINGSAKGHFVGHYFFGIVMFDTREGKSGIAGTGSVIFIPAGREKLIQTLRERLAQKNLPSYDLYQAFVEIKELDELTEFEHEVLTLVDRYCNEFQIDSRYVHRSLRPFLLEVKTSAKKPGAVAAGVIMSGYSMQLIHDGGYQNLSQIAQYFDVSTSSATKYRDLFNEFITANAII